MRSESSSANRLTNALFIIYLAALVWILVFKLGVRFSYMGSRRVNLIPFREPLTLSGEIVLNVLIFVPLGLYAGVLFQKWIFTKKILLFVLVSLLIEGLEYILSIGAFDSTDVITNTSGGIIGLMIFKVIESVSSNNFTAQKFINIIAGIGTVLMTLLLVLLKLNMLPVKYQ